MGFFKAGGKLAARMVSNGMYHICAVARIYM